MGYTYRMNFDQWMRETKMHDWTDDMRYEDWKDRAYERALTGLGPEIDYVSRKGYLEGFQMGISMRAIRSMVDDK